MSLAILGGPILPVGQSFGYGLWSENYGGRTPLGWTLRARMFAASRSGEIGREVDHEELKVRTISAADEVKLYLDPHRRPGFYRYDLEILDDAGKLLGAYSRYLKVFGRPFWKVKLGLNGHRFRPGQLVLSRIENLGTEQVMYGEEFRVQRFEEGSWESVSNGRQGWQLWLGMLGPGASGSCTSFRIPRDFEPGLYRILKEVGPEPWPRGKRSYYLTAPFEVVGQ